MKQYNSRKNRIVIAMSAVLIGLGVYAQEESCMYTFWDNCHYPTDQTWQCPSDNYKEVSSTWGEDYDMCLDTTGGYGDGYDCENDGNKFCCTWDVYATDCSGNVRHFDGGGMCDVLPGIQQYIQPTYVVPIDGGCYE